MTSIIRNILTIKKIHRVVGRAKDLSTPLYVFNILRAFSWNKKNKLTARMHGVENFKTFPF